MPCSKLTVTRWLRDENLLSLPHPTVSLRLLTAPELGGPATHPVRFWSLRNHFMRLKMQTVGTKALVGVLCLRDHLYEGLLNFVNYPRVSRQQCLISHLDYCFELDHVLSNS